MRLMPSVRVRMLCVPGKVILNSYGNGRHVLNSMLSCARSHNIGTVLRLVIGIAFVVQAIENATWSRHEVHRGSA